MKRVWQFIKNHPRDVIWGTIFILIAVCVVPLIIDWMFHLPARCDFFAVQWDVEDALAYYGSALGFIGTVVLGAITVYQTRRAHKQTKKANDQTERANQLAENALIQTQKANELSAQMQKLEQAKFLSIISVKKLYINQREISYPDAHTAEMENPIIFDMVDMDFYSFRDCYHIDVRFENVSEFPIVECYAQAKGFNRNAKILHGLKPATNSVYISPQKECVIRFIVPSRNFEKYSNDGIIINLEFVNVFDFATFATIKIEELDNQAKNKVKLHYNYQIKKITDVKPKEPEEELSEERRIKEGFDLFNEN